MFRKVAPPGASAENLDGLSMTLRRRTRKFYGAIAMVVFVVVYALVIMALAQARPLQDAPGWVRGAFYVIAGMGWILPLMPLIRWMERPDAEV